VGRICHNIFDRNYSADVTMREILEAVYGLLIVPEAEDPLDRYSICWFHITDLKMIFILFNELHKSNINSTNTRQRHYLFCIDQYMHEIIIVHFCPS